MREVNLSKTQENTQDVTNMRLWEWQFDL